MARTFTAKVLPYLEAIETAHRAGESWKDICVLLEAVIDARFGSPVCLSNAVRRARKGVNDGRLWTEQRPLSGMAPKAVDLPATIKTTSSNEARKSISIDLDKL
ncbi:hypothetical protein [Acidithiobacillus acidisediminis]|uniref:hypothetical protein n=1 Tax=Acidithiobacillus acidisediminis TaxID=2937799 RepID=UPI00200CD434|nr:hypothetical protein [Acidithiobacillus sp. S30A2]